MAKQTSEWKRGRAYTADATLMVESSSSGGYVWAVLRDGREVGSGYDETEAAAQQAAERAASDKTPTIMFDQLDDLTLEALFCALLVFCDDVHSNPEENVWERADELRTIAVAEMNRRRSHTTEEPDNANG